MNFLNLGIPEIIFIIIIALIVIGPNNMVKSAKDAGSLLRKVSKSPYWKEVWATKRDLDELPKMLAKEAQLNETIQELDRDSRKISGSVNSAVKELLQEVNRNQKSESETRMDEDTLRSQETIDPQNKTNGSSPSGGYQMDKI